jgi:ArsR family transcriptional regulator
MSNKKNIQLERFAEVFKALSNPNRLKIFQRLASCCKPGTVSVIEACETACVGELGRELDIVPSTVSHHIKELRQAGLIRTRRRGQKIECWIDPGVVEQLRGFFSF